MQLVFGVSLSRYQVSISRYHKMQVFQDIIKSFAYEY